MICYLDKTFCPFHTKCADGNTCSRAITEDVVKGGTEWWGSVDFPIALYTEPPVGCFKPKGEHNDTTQ